MQSNISRNVSRTIFLAVVLLTGQTIKAEELPKTNLAEQGSVAQQTKRVSLAEAVQFTPEQKKAWQTMQRQTASHEQQMKKKYREIQILAQSGNYDEDKVEALAKEIAGDVKKYVEESAR
ncbi:MAG TPA: hypothetical protein PK031_06885 [Pseudomonadales bacterium]|nr:hypothetical protein [Pseudomonadales bacterium]